MMRAGSSERTSKVAKASLLVLTLTLFVLVWYTIETARLRAATQEQIKRSYLPIVVLEFTSRSLVGDDGTYDLHPTLRNVGFGPAFNVEVSGISNGDKRIDFDTVPGLGKESMVELRMLAASEDDKNPTTVFGELLVSKLPNRELVFNSFPVTITYLDGRGESQQVVQEIQVQIQKREVTAVVKSMKTLDSKGGSIWFESSR